MSIARHALPVHATPLGSDLRRLLRQLGYTPNAIAEAVDSIGVNSTAEGCEAIEAEDLGAVEDLVIRHTGAVESDASRWPAWTDADVWNPTPEPEPFHPSPEDVSWADRMARYDEEDMEFNASLAGAIDALCEGLVPPDAGRYDDHDAARCGAVG